jgi:hypothetical protein
MRVGSSTRTITNEWNCRETNEGKGQPRPK